MLTVTDRPIDTDIVNLTGGLFADAHVTAPIEPEPEPVVPNRGAARAQARRARRASRIVGTVAAAVLVGGFAAAHQAVPSIPARVLAPPASPPASPAPTPARHAVATLAVASPPDTPANAEDLTPTPRRAPDPTPTARRFAPPAMPLLALPEGVPAPAPQEALAASPVAFDRAGAAVSLAEAARSASACLPPDETARTARVRVTFASSGRATSVTVDGGPFVGTAVGACVARALRAARVHAFAGEPVAVTTTVRM